MSNENEEELDFGDLDETYENVEAPSGGSADSIPDGNYTMTIVSCYPSRAKESGNRCFKWKMKVEGPRLAGTYLWRNSTLEADRIKWFKKDMLTLGVALKSLNDITKEDWRDENLLGLQVEVTVRNKDGYCNIYFNKAGKKVAVDAADNAPDPSGGFSSGTTARRLDDDDVPF